MKVIDTKVNSVAIHIKPNNNFRTTKGGKKILNGSYSYMTIFNLGIDELKGFRSGDIFEMYDGVQAMYKVGGGYYMLMNTGLEQTNQLVINTNKPLTLKFLGRVSGENS